MAFSSDCWITSFPLESNGWTASFGDRSVSGRFERGKIFRFWGPEERGEGLQYGLYNVDSTTCYSEPEVFELKQLSDLYTQVSLFLFLTRERVPFERFAAYTNM